MWRWLCLSMATTPAFAGPWVRDPGSGYAKVGWTRFQSDDGFVGGQATGLRYRSDALDTYVEVGLPGDLQIVASLPYVRARNTDSGGTGWLHRWTGDLRVELDRRLHPDRPLAVGIEVRLPTYRRPGGYGTAKGLTPELLGAFARNFPELGDRNVDVTFKFLAGHGFSRGWVTAEIGPRFRSGGYAHGIYGAGSLGMWAVPDHLGISLYATGNANVLPAFPRVASRQIVYGQLAVFATGLDRLPGAGLQASVGVLPFATAAAAGMDASVSTFLTW